VPPFKKHIFICTNFRDKDPASSCGPKGSVEIQKKFKERLKEMGLNLEVRANQSGCLDMCKNGVSLVIYPQGLWYGHVTINDVDEIIEKSVVQDEIIERLKL
jgi:(2Fe-2S) ferredoxin